MTAAHLIHHFLENSAAKHPDKIAVVDGDKRVTYSEINTRANQLANWLIARGINQGDRVVILFENSVEYVISYYGVLKSGGVTVPLSTDLKSDGLVPLLKALEPEAVICSPRTEKVTQEAVSLSPVKSLVVSNPKLSSRFSAAEVDSFEDILASGNPSNPETSCEQSSLASIIYTSGSTGLPKGAMLSHGNIVTNTTAICEYLKLTQNDIQMAVLPFFYVMGKSLLNTHFAVGGTVVINNKFAYPASVLKQMVDEEVTGFSGVPSTYAFLLYRSPLTKFKERLGALRYCSQAGGHMPNAVKKDLRRVLPARTQIFIMYGATEAAARITYLDPQEFENRMDSIGKPVHGVTLRVLDETGKDLPAGKVGNLVASGPNIMRGYWNEPEATADVLDEEGYHTGDLGYQDNDGYFYVVGRKDMVIKAGGHRINPLEIEDTIMGTELVSETAVLGVEDGLLGNRLVALATPRAAKVEKNDILRKCAEVLPKYKVPKEIYLIKDIPKKSSGKIDRETCLRVIEAGRAESSSFQNKRIARPTNRRIQ